MNIKDEKKISFVSRVDVIISKKKPESVNFNKQTQLYKQKGIRLLSFN